MPTKPTSSSILAKGPEAGSAATSSRAVPQSEPLLASDADPDVVVDRILGLLSQEHYPTARRLAAEALGRFPNHTRVQNAWSVFDRLGKASAGPQASEPSRDEEFEWLRNPPESVRGKWVALLSHEMIDSAETLAELEESLTSKDLPQSVLVHFID